MESTTILIEGGEWSSFNGVSVNEEADFMAKLFTSSSLNREQEMSGMSLSSSCYSGHKSNINSLYCTSNDSNLYSVSQGSSYSGNSENAGYPCQENYYLSDPNQFFEVNDGSSMPIEFCLNTKGFLQVFPGNPMERNNHSLNLEMSCDNLDDSENNLTQNENLELKQECSTEIEPLADEKSSDSSDGGRKRSRKSEEVQKASRNVRSKRNRKSSSDDDEDNINTPVLNRQNSSSCSSEEDLSGENSNAAPEPANTKGKTRASRGSATDPQSLYARKRRERINERLRILQGIVPNGTKVDISTMLEEAVHYVKFLQLQIKLLSSDDMWMFAPLAYNGMDIGLNAKLNSLI